MPRPSRQRGFALLITITLLAFLVLLLVSLASLTRVETSVADNNQRLAQARQNALFSLNLALGQLQKYAGPDNAVTARAEITDANPVTQPNLTGVWKTTNATVTPDVWLVSGNESSPVLTTPLTAPDPVAGAEPATDGFPGQVFLVGSNSVSSNAQRVRLDKQLLTAAAGTVPGLSTSATIGHYAWWIGDEGIKASASLINPLLGPAPISYDNTDTSGSSLGDNWSDPIKRARLDHLQLTRPRLEQLFAGTAPDADWLVGQPKITTLQQLQLLASPPTATQLKDYFHDLTPLSLAVLADVSGNRLKRDLSDPAAAPDPAIASFLRTRVITDGTSVNAYSGYVRPVAPSNPAATSYPIYSLGPIMDMLGIHLNFYLSTADNKVHYSYTVSAQFWNPYTAELHLDPAAPLTIELRGLPAFTLTTDSGVTNLTFTPPVITLTVPASTTWKPGEFKNFRGGVVLGPDSAPGAIFDAAAPGAPADPTATAVTVTFPGTSVYNGVLKLAGNVLATYTPPVWGAAAATYAGNASAPPSNGTAPGSTGWMLGYGYQFAEDARVVTGNYTALGNTDCFDPRKPVMNGRYYNPAPGSWNRLNVANNTVPSYSSGTWGIGPRYPIYDLPRQEVFSLGMLSHIIGEKPYSVGNAWGGPINAVFDQYYISTLPRNAPAWTPESGLPVPNRYVEIYHPPGVTAIPPADLLSGENSARYLLQKGAFNINSTSASAWKTILGSKLPNWTYTANETTGVTTTTTLDNVFFRSPHGAQQLIIPPPISTGTGVSALTDLNANRTSGRQLTTTEVSTLADRIVARIRTRTRPYLSLQEFLNSGDLENAITDLNPNASLPNGRKNMPGALTQADIVRLIAPFMSARSDTFRIRAYGDVQNPVTGAVDGRAWCEALVQRVPDLVNAPSAPLADVISPDPVAHPFGRQFKIISFRWLTSADI